MTSGSCNFNDFPENQFTKSHAVYKVLRQMETMHYHALFCSKKDFSVFTTVNINSLNTSTAMK